jgi:co-chaperonin GroES (HSP10)
VIIQPEDDITHVGTTSMGTKTMKPARGVVLAVGTTKALGNGGRHAMDVRQGDLVIYTKVSCFFSTLDKTQEKFGGDADDG